MVVFSIKYCYLRLIPHLYEVCEVCVHMGAQTHVHLFVRLHVPIPVHVEAKRELWVSSSITL